MSSPAGTTPTVRIISIGTLARHPMWNEAVPVRTGHATCTLIRAGKAVIIVDPGLPTEAIAARLHERSGVRPSEVTHVFLTSFQPDTARGLGAFDRAQWLVSAIEREAVGIPLIGRLKHADANGETAVREEMARQIKLLHRCEAAETALSGDSLAPGVDLFPLPGMTPGLCGLMIDSGDLTTLICGDAVATIEHYTERKVLPLPYNLEQAKTSFGEAVQIADLIVPGRDNLLVNDMDVGPSAEDFEKGE